MMHIAEVDSNGIVLRVVTFDPLNISNGFTVESAVYNTKAGMLYIQTYPDRSVRKNFAGVGFVYDAVRDAFIPPKPYPSWLLDELTCRWEAPIPYPLTGNIYSWDEPSLQWIGV